MAYNILSKFYDRLMSDVDYDAWCDFIIKTCNIKKGTSVVDVACGTGAISVRLAKIGANVIGIDNSDEMLCIAADNARKNGVNAVFTAMDMSDMHFHKPVDAICCVCDGVNYISQDMVKSFIKNAHASLKVGGTLIFDISSEYKLTRVLADNLFFEDYDDLTYMWQNTVSDGSVLMELCFFEKQKDGSYLRSDEQHTQYIHSTDTVYSALCTCGFSDVRMFDCYSLAEINDVTERITFVAKK